MKSFVLTIIGLGPRGLTLLDRLIETYRWKKPDYRLRVHAVEPGEPGQGVHRSSLLDHLLVNTPARMITMFPHQAIAGAPARREGPSLPEWARMAGYRRVGSHYLVCDVEVGEEISDEDYLPRGLLGKYLSWYFDKTVSNLPGGLTVVHNKLRAIDVAFRGGEIVAVKLETGFQLKTDFLFVATGHGVSQPSSREIAFSKFVRDNEHRNGKLLFIRDPYPLEKLESVDSRATVALQGSGLTAHDIIAELTVGRGGEFVQDGNRLVYRTSGREPSLLLFSRSGLPFCARAVNQKKVGALYKAHFFRTDVILAMRNKALAAGGDGRLDFDRDVLPLMVKEMAYVYAVASRGSICEPSSYEPSAQDLESVEAAMHPLRSSTFQSIQEFKRFIVDYLEADLRQAELGNQAAPIKAAVEVIRESRECLRLAVEYCGLTAESHKKFDARYQPMMNRLTFGPPMQRNRELLALIRAGVLDLAAGPDPTIRTDERACKFVVTSEFTQDRHSVSADVLILGRIDLFRPAVDTSPFYRNLLSRGIVRPFCNGDYHASGLDIDRNSHPLTNSGVPVSNMWVVGYPVEGAHFFTHALPLPLFKSRHVMDADRCVLDLFDNLSRPSLHGADMVSHARRQTRVGADHASN
jgi:uncharacterized NAD(P)/FAD-binding protein YdhS